MAKYHVYGKVYGTKYIGEFEAESKEAAVTAAENSGNGFISFCHQCSKECDDPQLDEMFAELDEA